MPTQIEFETELRNLLSKASRLGFTALQVNAGNLHRRVGDYPGPNHRMPPCCDAMRKEAQLKDIEVPNDLAKNGASFEINFRLPR